MKKYFCSSANNDSFCLLGMRSDNYCNYEGKCKDKRLFEKKQDTMKNKTKDTINQVLLFIIVVFCIWMPVSKIIQASKCPQLTQTQLFMKIQKSIICKWEKCD